MREASGGAREMSADDEDLRKRISHINERIKRGDVVVLTAEEFKRKVRDGCEDELSEVDVVTTGTCGLMSGTAAIFSIEVAERGAFERAEAAWLNGVPAFPGPCPNERLGVIDVTVFGTSRSSDRYGGGHLFHDIVSGKEVDVEVRAAGGSVFRRTATVEDFMFARLFTTRSAFRNYMGFVNTDEGIVKTIFSVSGLRGPLKEVSVCGCGEINPLENDPEMRIIKKGTKIMVNGAEGLITGEGTRSTPERRNIAVVAEMKKMNPEFMGGFITSAGPECITSIAVPVPNIVNMGYLRVLDEEVKMPIAEIQRRTQIAESNYGRVWQNTSLEIQFDSAKCLKCDVCAVERKCPVNAFRRDVGIDKKCFNCGFCVFACEGGAFTGDLGSVEVEGRSIPVTLRLSSREKARKLCILLKKMIESGEFMLSLCL